MNNEVIKLVSEVKTVNEYGDTQVTQTERMVYAKLASVSQSEFYQAQAVGLKPELKFIIADYLDYGNEQVIKYQGFGEVNEAKYSVIRTYRKGNELEITCKRGIDT